MAANSSSPRVWVNGRWQEPDRHDAALTALCQEVERTVRPHQAAGVRAVVFLVAVPAPDQAAAPVVTPTPVYVDVFDSGYGHGI